MVDILTEQNLFEKGGILNGSFYDITYDQSFDVSSKLSTTDGFIFGHGDYLIFHGHETEKVIYPYLSSSYILKCGASRYEIENIINDIHELSTKTNNAITAECERAIGVESQKADTSALTAFVKLE